MGLFVGSDQIAPRFIRDVSAIGLQKRILREQMRKAREYKFISFYYADGYHYAWYYEENSTLEIMENKNGDSI